MSADLPTIDYLDELVDTDPAQLLTEAIALRARAQRAEAAIARVRELADGLAQEPHPTHDHICPDGLRAELLAALDGAGAVSEEHTQTPNSEPALRNCLVPGCLAQYDAIAALTGEQPARPDWSSKGWRIIRSGMPFPSGGHICPAHVEIVTAHLPHRIQGDREWVQAECKCGGWTSPRLRWHGAVRGLWEEHLLLSTC